MVKSLLALAQRRALANLLLLSAAVSACSINPVSNLPEVTLITVEQEKKIGGEEAKKVEQEMGLLDDPALTSYVDAVGQRLVKESPRQDLPHQFHVVDMIEPNAFALPGGYVYVTRGLLALVNTEDELAGVVGHEIGHVAARHTVQRISRQGPFALITNLVSGVTGFFVPVVGNIVGGWAILLRASCFLRIAGPRRVRRMKSDKKWRPRLAGIPLDSPHFWPRWGVRKRS